MPQKKEAYHQSLPAPRKSAFLNAAVKVLEKIRDTKYITCNINERLALIRLEISELRSELIDSHDAKTAENRIKKLHALQEEYNRVLRLSQNKGVG